MPDEYRCRYCGQMSLTAESEEEATRSCHCPEARTYNFDITTKEAAAENRAKALNAARMQIKRLFSGGGEGYGWISISDELAADMLHLAELIYDEEVGTASVGITANTRLIIAKTAKGKLRIQRRDLITNQAEI